MLKLENITYTRNSNNILNSINLNILENDFVTIVGPSGCGKTTLLRIIAGFDKPTQGKIIHAQKEVTGIIDQSRLMVFQEHALFYWLTVKGNIEFGLKTKKNITKDERESLVYEYLSMIEMDGFIDYNISALSTGQRARVAIARALIMNPDILLMDEPFAALDAEMKETLQNSLRLLWLKTRKTIVFITHDIDEACLLGTKVIVLSNRPTKIQQIFHNDKELLRTPEDITEMTKKIRQLLHK